ELLEDIKNKISEISRKYPNKPVQKKKPRPDSRGPHGRPYPPGRDKPGRERPGNDGQYRPGKVPGRGDFKHGPPNRYPKKHDDARYKRPYNPKKQR
nr:hypothetical protein [Candidatus Sigynarchaeota archaeon]